MAHRETGDNDVLKPVVIIVSPDGQLAQTACRIETRITLGVDEFGHFLPIRCKNERTRRREAKNDDEQTQTDESSQKIFNLS